MWPPRYLVHEWMTRSAPASSGRWLMGVAKVASMTSLAPPKRCLIATSLPRSTTRRYGLVGDSDRMTLVLPGTSAVLQAGEVARRDQGGGHAVAAEEGRHELPGAPVAVRGHHQVIPGLQQRQQRGGAGGHAAGEQRRLGRPIQRGQLALGRAHGRVAVAAVLLALGPALEVVAQGCGVVEHVRGRADDGGGDGVVGVAVQLTGVHRPGAQAGVGGQVFGFLGHGESPLLASTGRWRGGGPDRRGLAHCSTPIRRAARVARRQPQGGCP